MAYIYEILDNKGKKVGDQTMSKDIFSDDIIDEGLVHEYVVMYLSNQRQSTAHTKTRSEVRNSGRKLYRQKGTGSARVGDAGSPIRRKGGVVFGPRKYRNRTKAMNAKMKKKAMISAVALKAKSTQLHGRKDLSLAEVKTKIVADTLGAMPFAGSKTLIVLPEHNDVQQKSIRNLAKAKYVVADKLNPYDLMSWKHVVFVGDAYEKLEERLK